MKIVMGALLLVLSLSWSASAGSARYGVATAAVPVLNVPAIERVFGGRDGRSLKTDACGQVRELEYIALPGTSFRILDTLTSGSLTVYLVETEEYSAPPGTHLYVDSRLIEPRQSPPPPRLHRLPPTAEIVSRLRGALGSPYVWGGNVQLGLPEMARLYFRGNISKTEKPRITLAGLDCSGLLYAATDGWTPRNTSELVSFGGGIAIAGRNARQIAALLRPLDLIVWNGHVIIVLDSGTAIESRLECGKPGHGGVVQTPLHQRLDEIMQMRRPADAWPAGEKRRDIFVVRRWL